MLVTHWHCCAQEFATIGSTILTMFTWMMSGPDFNAIYTSHNSTPTIAAAIIYNFVM